MDWVTMLFGFLAGLLAGALAAVVAVLWRFKQGWETKARTAGLEQGRREVQEEY